METKAKEALDLEAQKAEDEGEKLQLIVFNLGSEEYAVPIEQVKEIVPTPRISPVPQTPDYVKGIANIRGQVISVINLEKKFGFKESMIAPAQNSRSTSFILVIEHGETSVGVLVNQVPTTFAVPVSKIDSSDNMMQHSTLDASIIKGVANTKDRLIILIDIMRMLELGTIKTTLQEG